MDDLNARMQRDLDDIAARLRTLEAVDTPRQRELVEDLRRLRQRVEQMDVEGTAVTNERIRAIQASQARVERYLDRQDADKRADRRAVLVAILGAAVAIALAIFQVVSR